MVEWSPTMVFFVILLSVPLQFYLSPRSSSDAKYYLYGLVEQLKRLYNRYISSMVLDWSDRSGAEVEPHVGGPGEEIVEMGTLEESKQKGAEMFGGSEEPRDPRSPYIKFRVGQVIRHRIHNYKAVIIGWDEIAKAPAWWLDRAHRGAKNLAEMPNYTVLIDTRDRLIPQIGYVAEDNIVLERGAVVHPMVEHFFESFDGECYNSRPWHRRIYPND